MSDGRLVHCLEYDSHYFIAFNFYHYSSVPLLPSLQFLLLAIYWAYWFNFSVLKPLGAELFIWKKVERKVKYTWNLICRAKYIPTPWILLITKITLSLDGLVLGRRFCEKYSFLRKKAVFSSLRIINFKKWSLARKPFCTVIYSNDTIKSNHRVECALILFLNPYIIVNKVRTSSTSGLRLLYWQYDASLLPAYNYWPNINTVQKCIC